MPKTLTIQFPDDEKADPKFECPSVDHPAELAALLKRAYAFVKSKGWTTEDIDK